MSGVQIFVEDEINPFIGTGVNPAAIDDFQGDNFDHAGLGFFGGGYLYPSISGGRPSQVSAAPPRTPPRCPTWGAAPTPRTKHPLPRNARRASYFRRPTYLALHPTY